MFRLATNGNKDLLPLMHSNIFLEGQFRPSRLACPASPVPDLLSEHPACPGRLLTKASLFGLHAIIFFRVSSVSTGLLGANYLFEMR
jgi:hypothetical protein